VASATTVVTRIRLAASSVHSNATNAPDANAASIYSTAPTATVALAAAAPDLAAIINVNEIRTLLIKLELMKFLKIIYFVRFSQK
jgi:hypothetical protein